MGAMKPAIILFVATFTVFSASTDAASHVNVYTDGLQSCSTDGTALAGQTRTGMCVTEDDTGSHHICIDLSSNTATNGNGDGDGDGEFCTAMGPGDDGCSSEGMPCHGDPSDASCPVRNWCVCQWAFASYIDAAGGCDAIQDVVCESINMLAVRAYQKNSDQEKYANALDCLVERCEIGSPPTSSSTQNLPSSSTDGVGWAWRTLAMVLLSATWGESMY